MMAFLAIAGNAVWGQSSITINNDPITTGGTGWTYQENADDNNVITISTAGTYTIKGTEGSSNNTNIQIILSGEGEYNITFDNFRTDARLGEGLQQDPVYDKRSALTINSGAIVTLSWTGINKFWSSPQCAGINVKDGAELILKGNENDGYLEAGSLNNSDNKHTDGAGIGGDANDPNFGTIVIESGVVKARCESKTTSEDARAAGIGGGYKENSPSTKGTIIIKGGKIEAACWSVEQQTDYESDKTGNSYSYGAGIGGGYKGTCTNIAILGGSVIANSNGAEDIGVGKDYAGSNGIEKGIVIGQWAEDTTAPSVKTINNGNATINDVNIVKGEDGSLNGKVTMPAGTQMYAETPITLTAQDDPSKFYAYQFNLQANDRINEDGTHGLKPGNELNLINNIIPLYYLGASKDFSFPILECTEDHLFMGWSDANGSNFVYPDTNVCTLTTPNKNASGATYGIEQLYYWAIWVDNDYTIVVPSGKEWTADGKDTPAIYTAGGQDHLQSLTFSFSNQKEENSYKSNVDGLFYEGNGLSFQGNKLIGTPTLPDGMNYLQEDIPAYVKLGENGAWRKLTIHIRCAEKIVIDAISKSQTNHIYDGKPHNGLETYRGDDNDHLLKVSMMADWGDSQITESDLKEGVHYRISSYVFGGNTIPAEGESSALITDAGTYSDVTVEAKDGVTFASSLTSDRNSYKLEEVITVAQRPMNISISFNKQSIEEDEELTWDDVTVTPQALEGNSNSGIVAKDAEDFKKAVTGKITYTLNEEGTIATVKIYDVAVADQGEFLVSNYDLTINGDSYTEGMDVDLDDPEIPVASSSTGGNFNDHRYQLFLANKDYLKTDKKTVEYYEDLKLELFSRHNKKYTDAGGSFTIWYEKDGEANVGGYRLFWSKSGEHGDYQEVKFDPVSEYFRIDNVHSDVYVKIYDADGFPVANEAITAQDFRAYAQANKIIVITPEPTDVQIISMAGAVVAADKVTGQREFANLAEGVYIVRMGETIVKLQVRN